MRLTVTGPCPEVLMDTMNVIDYLITGFLVFAIVMFLIGKGDTLMNLFTNKQTQDVYKEYDHDKMNRSTLIFCIFLLLDQLGMMFLGDMIPYWGLISIFITIAIFAAFLFYLRKFARKQ